MLLLPNQEKAQLASIIHWRQARGSAIHLVSPQPKWKSSLSLSLLCTHTHVERDVFDTLNK